jgi:hypothetical protein
MRNRAVALLTLPLMFACIAPANAEVFRCTVDGKVVYSDAPCGPGAKTIPIDPPPDPLANQRVKSKLGPPGTKLDVPEDLVRACFDAYRVYARDPTAAKIVSYRANIAPIGFPVLVVTSVFLNKSGGPDREELWCKLTDSFELDLAAMKENIEIFREDQDETLKRIHDALRRYGKQ